jgi:kynureninase
MQQEPNLNYQSSLDFARQADLDDPLRQYRDSFLWPEAKNGFDCVYLCGNSLGLQPVPAASLVQQELDDWARLGVEGHFHARRPWLSYHRNASHGLAYLAGAKECEVVAMNSLTVNLHLLMTTFYRPASGRAKILIEAGAFPSDRFAVQSQIRLHGFDPLTELVEWSPRSGSSELMFEDLDAILTKFGDEIALILLPGIQYFSGQLLDMRRLCDMARNAGCNIGLDLAHAIGNVPLQLHEWEPDFAAWCSYKYLNSGPGAIAGAFVHEKHHGGSGDEQFLGWWSHDEQTRMKMSDDFAAEKGADLWQLSCPSVLSFAPLIASLEIFEAAGIDNLRQKSLRLTGFLDYLLRENFAGRVLSITPAHARGVQISMTIVDETDARSIFQKLVEQNVIVDWREPNVIRIAPVPLYNSFEDVFEFTRRLEIAFKT